MYESFHAILQHFFGQVNLILLYKDTDSFIYSYIPKTGSMLLIWRICKKKINADSVDQRPKDIFFKESMLLPEKEICQQRNRYSLYWWYLEDGFIRLNWIWSENDGKYACFLLVIDNVSKYGWIVPFKNDKSSSNNRFTRKTYYFNKI